MERKRNSNRNGSRLRIKKKIYYLTQYKLKSKRKSIAKKKKKRPENHLQRDPTPLTNLSVNWS